MKRREDAALKTNEHTCDPDRGRSSWDFVHRMIRAHVLTLFYYLTLQAMHTAPDMTWFSGTQNKYFKGIPVSLTLRKFLYLVILKKFQSSQSFLPCFNMDFYGDRPKQRIISAFWLLRSPISQALCERSIDRIPDLLSDINTNLISYPTPLFDIKTAIWTSPMLNLLHKI